MKGQPLKGMEAVVLAAGLGERLRPLSYGRPKCLFPVMNRPLLERCLEWLAGLGVVRVRLNAHYLMEQVEAWLDVARPPLPVELSRERGRILGTGGGIRQAAQGLGATFAVVNADCVLRNVDLAAMLARHRESRALATLLLQEAGSARNVSVEDGRVTSIRGRPQGAAGLAVGFTGLHLMEPELLSRIPEGVSDIIDIYLGCLARGGEVCGFVSRGHYFCDIGTPATYLGLHHDVFAGRLALRGATAKDGVCLAPDVALGPGCEIGPEVAAGPGVRFGAGCTVRRSVIWEGAEVAPGVELEGCVVGQGARVAHSATGEVLVRDEGR